MGAVIRWSLLVFLGFSFAIILMTLTPAYIPENNSLLRTQVAEANKATKELLATFLGVISPVVTPRYFYTS
jgi:hypothetical protein